MRERARVPGGVLRRAEARLRARSTSTTATSAPSSRSCSTTPTRSRSCTTTTSRRPSPTRSPRSPPERRPACCSRSRTPATPTLLDGARDYEAALAAVDASTPATTREPSGDDLIFLYTGGTTGYPKAVMWRSDDLYVSLWQMARPGTEPPDVATSINAGKQAATLLPACPLMHGTGLFIALSTLSGGGTVVLLDTPRLDPEAVWTRDRTRARAGVHDRRRRVRAPAARRARRRTRPLGSLGAARRSRRRASRGARRRSAACSRTCPSVTLIDSLGASEGIMTRTETRASDDIAPARFKAGERLVVVTDDGDVVQPGRRTRRHARRRRPDPARLLQGPGEDRGDVPHGRGPPLLDPRRLRDRRPRRHDPAARPRLGVHQHRRREGLPRRGRARAARRIPTCSTASSSASPTIAGARWSSRSCNRRRRDARRSGARRALPRDARGLQGAEAFRERRLAAAFARGQGRLQTVADTSPRRPSS